MELKKDVKALDHYYYYMEGSDTSYVLTEMFTVESMSNSVLYRFVPVYGPAEEDYTIPVAYFESFDEAFGLVETVEKAAELYMKIAHLPRINTITDEDLDAVAKAFNIEYRKDFLGE